MLRCRQTYPKLPHRSRLARFDVEMMRQLTDPQRHCDTTSIMPRMSTSSKTSHIVEEHLVVHFLLVVHPKKIQRHHFKRDLDRPSRNSSANLGRAQV
jgi:hypothetical protein